MRQTKLFELVQTFTPAEHKRWKQYLCSEFACRNETLRQLALALGDPGLSLPQWDRKALYARVFGKKEAYNELKFNNLVSDLYALTLDWLAFERLQRDELVLQRERTQALLERNLFQQAQTALQKYRSLLERYPLRNENWYKESAHMERIAEILHSRQRRADSPHLFQELQNTRVAHAIGKLRLAVALSSRSRMAVMQALHTDTFSADLEALRADEALLGAAPAAQAYLAAYDLLEKPSRENYLRLTALLETNHHLLDKEELGSLYQCALNYCIHRINTGNTEAYTDALTLYRALLDRKLLLQQGRLSQWTYKNIATTGLRSGEFEWTEAFLHEYRQYLAPEERDNAYSFNLATLYFEKNEFSKLLQTLQNVEFKDISYHVGAKVLQMKTYYLLGEYEPLLSLISSSFQLLRRDSRLSAFGRTTNLNFLKMLRSLCNWQLKRNPDDGQEEKERLIAKIMQTEPLAHRDWLIRCGL